MFIVKPSCSPRQKTLKPGQRLSWHIAWRHEEGWSYEGWIWEWDGEVLTEEYGTDGTDCDGRLSTRFARFDQLRVVQVYSWHDFEYPLPIINIPVDGVFYPA